MPGYRCAAVLGCLIALTLACQPARAQTTERDVADERAQSAPARIEAGARALSPSARKKPLQTSGAETDAAAAPSDTPSRPSTDPLVRPSTDQAEAAAKAKAEAEAAEKATAEAAAKAKAEAEAAEKATAEAAAKAKAEAEAAEKARAEAAAKAKAEAEAAEKARAEAAAKAKAEAEAAEKARAEATAKATAEAEAAEKARAEAAAKAKAEAEAAEKARAEAAAKAKAEAEAAEKATAEAAAKAKAEAEAAEKARAEAAAKAKAEAEAAEKARAEAAAKAKAEAEAAEKARAEAAAKRQAEVTGTLAGKTREPLAGAAGKPNDLVVASWGGAYQDGQAIALFKPFEEVGKGRIDAKKHSGGREVLETAKTEGWDVVDLTKDQVASACSLGLLERIAPIDLPPGKDGVPAKEDFLPGAIHDCGIGSMAWAHTIVYDASKLGKRVPKTVADFFDQKRFPGKRALRKTPRYTLELALLADGVPAEEVYQTLATEAGLLRAFAKLDTIKSDIVWWGKGFEPLRLLADGKAAMATAFNGRAFFWAMRKEPSLRILWSGQVYDFDLWAIPKTSKRKEAARQFIAFATAPQRMADLASLVPYGPLRRSAVAKVGRHAELGVEMKPFLPTTRQAMKTALAFDGTWWSKNESRIAETFDKWLRGEPLVKPADDAGEGEAATGTEAADKPADASNGR